MAKGYMARIGSFTFSIDSAAFQQLERKTSYKWAKQERIGRNPALQFVGREAETITLQGTIYPHFRGGLGQMAQIRALAGSGMPQDFAMCDSESGTVMGRWVVESVRETRTVFFADGAPRKIDFSITLTEYGEDA